MYTDIDSTKRHIRLLTVYGGVLSDIHCSLRVVPLDSSITFKALLYVWGSAEERLAIRLNGQQAYVTRNLELALRHLRYINKSRVLWMDALCINQADDFEKSHQVRIIRDIYSAASQVIVWLRPKDERIVRSFKRIKTFAEDPALYWAPCRADESPPKRSPYQSSFGDIFTLDLVELFQNPWWTRVWTVQEAVRAKNLIFVCGDHFLEEDEMDRMLNSYYFHVSEQRCCNTSILDDQVHLNISGALGEHLISLKKLLTFKRQVQINDFLQVATAFQTRDATDDRDRVYAFIGISRGINSQSIDYGLGVREIYENTTRELIHYSGTLDVLSYIIPPEDDSTDGLPSWVYDWVKKPIHSVYSLGYRAQFHRLYNASASGSIATLTNIPGILDIHGLLVDVVEATGEPRDRRVDIVGQWEEWPVVAGVAQDPHKLYIARGTVGDAYWRTITSDTSTTQTVNGEIKRATRRDAVLYVLWWLKYCTSMGMGMSMSMSRGKRGNVNNDIEENIFQFQKHLSALNAGKRFFRSKKGYFGVGPEDAKLGDLVCIVAGGRMPLILRTKEPGIDVGYNDTIYCKFIGDGYVHGIMDGEAKFDSNGRELPLRTFLLT